MRHIPPRLTHLKASTVAEIPSTLRERMVFMDFRCLFLGELRRIDLMKRFGISSAAATRDIAYYRRAFGAKIELDPIRKVYRPVYNFVPAFTHDMDRALTALSRGFGETQTERTRPLVKCEVPPHLSTPSVEVLAPISRCIFLKRALRIRYSSFSSGQSTREIAPFALANNGLRWHIRAFDRKRACFVDFVLTRIHEAIELHQGNIEEHELPEHDLEWGRILELELVPHPKERRPEIIEMDHNMKEGVLRIRVRAALASYLLRQWIVDCSPDHSLSGTEYRLWLRNTPILYGVANAQLAPGYPAQKQT